MVCDAACRLSLSDLNKQQHQNHRMQQGRMHSGAGSLQGLFTLNGECCICLSQFLLSAWVWVMVVSSLRAAAHPWAQ